MGISNFEEKGAKNGEKLKPGQQEKETTLVLQPEQCKGFCSDISHLILIHLTLNTIQLYLCPKKNILKPPSSSAQASRTPPYQDSQLEEGREPLCKFALPAFYIATKKGKKYIWKWEIYVSIGKETGVVGPRIGGNTAEF